MIDDEDYEGYCDDLEEEHYGDNDWYYDDDEWYGDECETFSEGPFDCKEEMFPDV
jgi:hypothetical protein